MKPSDQPVSFCEIISESDFVKKFGLVITRNQVAHFNYTYDRASYEAELKIARRGARHVERDFRTPKQRAEDELHESL